MVGLQSPERACRQYDFRLFSFSDKIVIDSFNDPKVQGVICHIARAQTGGVKGEWNLAEDTSDASISCCQVGPIKILGRVKDGESVFDEYCAAFCSRNFRLCASSTV